MKQFLRTQIKIFLKSAGLLAAGVLMSLATAQAAPTMNEYSAVPFFIEQATVKPNILIMLDNSGSMNQFVYNQTDDNGNKKPYDHNQDYYGYFSSHLMYSHDGSKFVIDESGPWSGNFLNYVTMRRIDVLRKVLAGGKALSAVGGGKTTLLAESATGYNYWHSVEKDDIVNADISDVSPYEGTSWAFDVYDDGEVEVWKDDSGWSLIEALKIEVQKDIVYEPDCFADNENLAGVMQKFANDAQWGNLWFVQNNDNKHYEGGRISNPVGVVGNFSSMITDIRNEPCDKWTPLAESYYVGMQHFRQKNAQDGTDVDGYPYTYTSKAADITSDPFSESEWCAKNFVLLLTDGMSTRDANIPSEFKDYSESKGVDSIFFDDEDGSGYTDESGRYASGGTDFLKDVAYYARSNDLRPDDVAGDNTLIPYVVFAFDDDERARNLLMETARQGGFEDRDGDGKPDAHGEEWDKDGDGVPDTYFEAQDGDKLKEELERAISAILERASSGTSASILSTNEEGEGSMIQAYFNPSVRSASGESTWLGYLQSLWIDNCGNIRDDSGSTPLELDTMEIEDDVGNVLVEPDKIIEFVHDEDSSATHIKRYLKHPNYKTSSCDEDDWPEVEAVFEKIQLEEIIPVFNAGRRLFEMEPDQRTVYTYIDEKVTDKQILFNTINQKDILPSLGINAESYDYYNLLGATEAERAENLIRFIRGHHINSPNFRSRLVTLEDENHNPVEKVWKLGDIVQSTPVTVSGAVENYHLLYSDRSYNDYWNKVKDRESVVYVGANDGMLHAFSHGKRTENGFAQEAGIELGTELWSYIPQPLLPHLKWLADPEYSHVYYADLKPKVFDARIDRGSGTPEWGTFMLLGLRMGGKDIWTKYDSDGDGVMETKEFQPTYTMIDITDPRDPEVMWERSYEEMGMSFVQPAIVRWGEKDAAGEWYAIFGSGPKDETGKADLQGWSDGAAGQAHVYVVKLATGDPVSNTGNDYLFSTSNKQSFFNTPASLDMNLNYNVDAIYLSEIYDITAEKDYSKTGSVWNSTLYKINVPVDWNSKVLTYPGPEKWDMQEFFTSDRPMTAPVAISVDDQENAWIYFGTGRFLGAFENETTGPVFDDRQSETQQYLFGVKDPYYNQKRHGDTFYHNNEASLTLDRSSALFDANSVDVAASDSGLGRKTLVFDAGTATLWDAPDSENDGSWSELVSYIEEQKDGWYIELDTYDDGDTETVDSSERVISKPALMGGITLCSTYTPMFDPCLFGGYSGLYGVYYRTGTAYKRHVLLDYDEGAYHYDGQNYTGVSKKVSGFVGAPPPSIGIHAGRDGEVGAYIQQSTGQILKLGLDPALNIRSGFSGWRTP